MLQIENYPRLIFPDGFNDRDIYESNLKGWICVSVEIEKDKILPMYFTDMIRLQQDFESAIEEGQPCFTEERLIIISEITIENIKKSVDFLFNKGFLKI